MISFNCRCGNVLFFENTACVQCQAEIGYESASNSMVTLDPGRNLKRCQNGQQYNVCNWVLLGDSSLCDSCRLNRIVPDLSVAENVDNWRRMEAAKSRALHTLLRFNLFPAAKADRPDGLAFDFLMPSEGVPVVTGHENGVITVNVREADDSYREKQRQKLGEPYRTLVGHFRHELGHYFWDRFFQGRPEGDATLEALRQVFGDERVDYAAALKRHYSTGAPADWKLSHVSAYATSHPWEDWAETWAQYLHMQDGLETARSFGWSMERTPFPFTSLEPETPEPSPPSDPLFLNMLSDWAKLSPVINEMAAGLGHPNLYPFVLSKANARKLHFVHRMVQLPHQPIAG